MFDPKLNIRYEENLENCRQKTGHNRNKEEEEPGLNNRDTEEKETDRPESRNRPLLWPESRKEAGINEGTACLAPTFFLQYMDTLSPLR